MALRFGQITMETNGDAETKEHEALDEQGGGEQDETETEAAEVKTEPQEVEMKVHLMFLF